MIRELVRCLREAESNRVPEGFPVPGELMEPDVFFDEECRAFFARFRDLYRDRGGEMLPSLDAIREAFDDGGRGDDFVARILLGPGAPDEEEAERSGSAGESPVTRFRYYGEQLRQRWLVQRKNELAREIREAEREGDEERLQTLYEKKKSLTREVYDRARRGA